MQRLAASQGMLEVIELGSLTASAQIAAQHHDTATTIRLDGKTRKKLV